MNKMTHLDKSSSGKKPKETTMSPLDRQTKSTKEFQKQDKAKKNRTKKQKISEKAMTMKGDTPVRDKRIKKSWDESNKALDDFTSKDWAEDRRRKEASGRFGSKTK